MSHWIVIMTTEKKSLNLDYGHWKLVTEPGLSALKISHWTGIKSTEYESLNRDYDNWKWFTEPEFWQLKKSHWIGIMLTENKSLKPWLRLLKISHGSVLTATKNE